MERMGAKFNLIQAIKKTKWGDDEDKQLHMCVEELEEIFKEVLKDYANEKGLDYNKTEYHKLTETFWDEKMTRWDTFVNFPDLGYALLLDKCEKNKSKTCRSPHLFEGKRVYKENGNLYVKVSKYNVCIIVPESYYQLVKED